MVVQKYHGDDGKHSGQGLYVSKDGSSIMKKRRIEIVQDKSDVEYQLYSKQRKNLSIEILDFYVNALCNRCQFCVVDIASFLP
jgi:hypothetical protein